MFSVAWAIAAVRCALTTSTPLDDDNTATITTTTDNNTTTTTIITTNDNDTMGSPEPCKIPCPPGTWCDTEGHICRPTNQ